MPAHELKAVIATLERVDQSTGRTGFQEQFAVREIDNAWTNHHCSFHWKLVITVTAMYRCWRNIVNEHVLKILPLPRRGWWPKEIGTRTNFHVS